MSTTHIINVLYPRTDKSTFDMEYYLKTHMPLVAKHFSQYGMTGWKVVEFPEGQYSVQAILEWSKEDGFPNASNSPEGKIVFGDITNFSNEQPTVLSGSQKASS